MRRDSSITMVTVQEVDVTRPRIFAQKRPSLWERLTSPSKNTDSPTISTCTTATNLSSWGSNFGSNGLLICKKKNMDRNIRVTHPEIEPLRKDKQDVEVGNFDLTEKTYRPTTSQKDIYRKTQVLTAISVSLVSCCVGYISAYTSPAAESLKKEIGITDSQLSWIGSLMPLCALVGGLIGGQLIDLMGRKNTIVATNLLFLISWILTATAQNIWYIYAGRSIGGISVGIASLALPVYLGETLQPEVRGSLGLFPTAFGNTGILLCFVAGSYVSWQILAIIGITLTLPFFALLYFIPETPRWFISKGKETKAQDALTWLRGKNTNVDEEYDELKKSQAESEKTSNFNMSDICAKPNMRALFISLGLMFFQQFSGINAVIFYTTSIFKLAGSSINESLCTIIVGLVNFISTFVATLVIDRLGRKVLLYISSSAMVITLGVLSGYFYLKDETDISVTDYGWVPLASFVIYVLGFSLGFGPIPWLMMGEILPAKIRGSAASISTAFNWSCTFIVTKTFNDIIEQFGLYGTFLFFCIICLFSIVFIVTCVPETSGRSLEDIERKLRRMSSVANLKPMPSTF